MLNAEQRAEVLVQAIPYIQEFSGKTVVVKYGGNAMQSPDLMNSVMQDLVLLQLMGIRLVLVHGGGPFISKALNDIGHKSSFIDGLRVTDEVTIDIAQQVLAGGVNKHLVHAIGLVGGRAMGICGLDGGLLTARKQKHDNVDLGYVGEITGVDCHIIQEALDGGYITVIASIASGNDGHVYNINADHAAAMIAAACGAHKLIVMTDVRGVMRDPKDPKTLISVIERDQIEDLQQAGILSGGMIPKMNCCLDALNGGVDKAHILDGTLSHAILLELLSDDGIGTMVK